MSETQRIRVGTRESPLALAQTRMVTDALRAEWPDLEIEVKTFKTQGDLILDTALSKVGDKGLFVKELEMALLNHEIDIAVHSMKDLPGQLPEGLAVISFGQREDARDVLIGKTPVKFADLPAGAVIGTSSLRREAQLRRIRPDLQYQTIRGNLQTRLRKLEEGPYEAIILAAAGVRRLGWDDKITQHFDPWEETIPAVGQGILGIEMRDGDLDTSDLVSILVKARVEVAKIAERSVLQTLEGGCQLPLGAHCAFVPDLELFRIRGIVLSPDGNERVVAERIFEATQAVMAGRGLALELLAEGGKAILDAIRI